MKALGVGVLSPGVLEMHVDAYTARFEAVERDSAGFEDVGKGAPLKGVRLGRVGVGVGHAAECAQVEG